METIKHFLISLAKEGLTGGHILHENRKYIFNKVKGVAQVEILEMKPGPRKEQPTEKREPVVRDQEMETIRPEARKISAPGRSFKYVAFILVFIAAVMLVIFGLPYLSKKSSPPNQEESSWQNALQQETADAFRQYILEYPQGRYSVEAVSRLNLLERQADTQSQFQQLLSQAETYLAEGKLGKAVQTLELAKTIRSGEEIEALNKKIATQISGQTEEEKFHFYVEMARQALSRDDLENANQNLNLAKGVRQGPETEDLNQKIQAKTQQIEKQKEQSRLFRLAEKALNQNEVEQASGYLTQAKTIETNSLTEALEAKIQGIREAEKKKLEQKKIDDVYGRYLGFARDYFQEGKYDRALENIQKARQIKDTDELNRFESDVRQKKSGKTPGATAKPGADQYRDLMENARIEFDQGRFDSALDHIRQARQINNNREADDLEKEIRRVQEGLERERLRIEEEKRKQQKQETVRSAKIIDLPPQLINHYNETLRTFEIVKLIRGIRVIGQISLNLTVQEDGRIAIQRFSDSGLEVNPPGSRKTVIDRIFGTLRSVKLPPPIDRRGDPVRVENWRISYSVGTFANKVIFRRKF